VRITGAWEQFFDSAGPSPTGSYDLLATEILTSATSSVTFSSLGDYAADYQHLQIRIAAQTNRGTFPDDNILIRFNADSATNYSEHSLRGNGSSVSSGATANSNGINCRGIGASGGGGSFGAAVIDILDPFETSKYKTTRSLSGYSSQPVCFESGNWRNTASVTSIGLTPVVGTLFNTGSRFSLYGIKAV
jgi:hypothetical protein